MTSPLPARCRRCIRLLENKKAADVVELVDTQDLKS